jgi:cytoplasmic iron level regulating protein YaaA (DUF328/UPF0246 family)
MKIIISPSKTMDLKKGSYLHDKELLYPKEHKKVLANLRKLSKKEPLVVRIMDFLYLLKLVK